MKYHYWVSYAHVRGFGATDITSPDPLESGEQVLQVSDAIEESKPHLGTVAVMWFTLLKTTDDSE